MSATQQLRHRLFSKLSELFQLDQPDLDFGFYRVMRAKAQEVQAFIGNDLLTIVADAFGEVDNAGKARLQAAYEKAVQTAKDFGAPDPEGTEPVKKARAALDEARNSMGAEAYVYDHLYRFFERYYDEGDFISRRYYTRETDRQAAPFAIPYHGEEVKLHWANSDQYYIKSTEYFSNFSFDLLQASEVRENPGLHGGNDTPEPRYVHFRISDLSQGEHGNVHAPDTRKRFFILSDEEPVAWTKGGGLIVNFEYRSDPHKTGTDASWRERCNTQAVDSILACLHDLSQADEGDKATLADYSRLLRLPAPTEKNPQRPLLAKYIARYTARNTMDYFIHKDLKGFLRRELDFYIKNEVLLLDDIDNASAPVLESYLSRIRVIRHVAGKLIDFLAQLEEFQKKLWLKKKFVVESNYCATLDRVDEELYLQIAQNESQTDEWVRLFAIDDIEQSQRSPGFTRPLSVDFLKANKTLVLDTRHFDQHFKEALLASMVNLDEQCDGLLVHSENFQALNLLQERYRNQLKCSYIDPPYNTGSDGFIYKDSYSHSSWLSMMADRLTLGNELLAPSAFQTISIDDKEQKRLSMLCESIYGDENLLNLVTVKMSEASGVKMSHVDRRLIKLKEYIHFIKKGSPKIKVVRIPGEGWNAEYKTYLDGLTHEKREVLRQVLAKERCGPDDVAQINSVLSGVVARSVADVLKEQGIPAQDADDWRFANAWRIAQSVGSSSIKKYADHLESHPDQDVGALLSPTGLIYIYNTTYSRKSRSPRIQYLFADDNITVVLGDIWTDIKTTGGVGQEGQVVFPNGKKPEKLLCRIFEITTDENDGIIDYFMGSGTACAVAHKMGRRWIGVEHGEYFDDFSILRMKHVLYGEQSGVSKEYGWNGGGLFKYVRLESYEDTLNNLRFDSNPARCKAVSASASLKADYMLHYMLDVETRGSQSLLNIDAFADPSSYCLLIKQARGDASVRRSVDLAETFNYLIGLRVTHIAMAQTFQARFTRVAEPGLPGDQRTRLMIDGTVRPDPDGLWWFRKIEGWLPTDPMRPDDTRRKNVLVIWRRLSGDLERDNLMLDHWFVQNQISSGGGRFDMVYVNGSNGLLNLRKADESWDMSLIEEEFMKRMWRV